MIHNNFSAPLADHFDRLIEKIAYQQVQNWDHQDLFNYACDSMAGDKKQFYGLDNIVEDYEETFSRSITHEINSWNVTPVPWQTYEAVMFRGMISLQKGQHCSLLALEPELTESRQDILFWSIYLQARDKENLCILNVANEEEAQLICASIFDHFYSE
ncbi:MAG: hypothetical protein H8E09_01045 [Gammaproteobacteria bacterium]|nr:hypothetical protein [Gammaproteobacteria bacterium]